MNGADKSLLSLSVQFSKPLRHSFGFEKLGIGFSTRIWEILCSNPGLDTAYPDRGILLFISP
jgi:hypothetical protein